MEYGRLVGSGTGVILRLKLEGNTMKNIIFKKSLDPETRTKSLSVQQNFEDKDCKTQVRKSFQYKVNDAEIGEEKSSEPQIHILKKFDTRKQIEMFSFQVKGDFHITDNRMRYNVQFEHNLEIEIHWKSKAFSPKKSVVLTK